MITSESKLLHALSSAPVCGMRLHDVWMLRLDLLPGPAPGNKYFKLSRNLEDLPSGSRVLSFGGAWSNHLHALAGVAAERGLDSIGVVRGERPAELSPTLADCEARGMHLHFVSRSDYRRRADAEFLAQLEDHFSPVLIIPEGGANNSGIDGCGDIVALLDRECDQYSAVALACGTGATLAGVAQALDGPRRAYGVPVLKGLSSLAAQLESWAPEKNWRLYDGYHCGGYAKVTESLQHFVLEFEQVQGVPLDPVYTGKLMYALYQLQHSGDLPGEERLIAIHTGGLQGRRGFDWLVNSEAQ